MPAYNAAQYIEGAILSVLQQDYSNWELLIVNDGSIDNTSAIVQSMADVRIRYFYQQNSGVSAARNLALGKMQGDFFCFLDADDLLTPQSISSRINLFLEKPDIGIVDGTVIVTQDDVNKVLRVYKPLLSGRVSKQFALLSESVFCMPSAMVRREVGKNYSFDPNMTHSEDIWFFLNLHNQSRLLFDSVDQTILYYRRVGNTAMSKLDGLAKGYMHFYDHVKQEKILKGVNLAYLKYKISRIMLLSYIRSGNVYKALNFVKSIVFR